MTPIDTALNVMNVNYFGAVRTIRAFLNLLKKSEHGRIVNFSTVAVALSLEGELAYGSSKAAIENLTRVLAKEISTFGITVNAVGPTPIHTDLIATVPEEKLNKILATQAIHRFGEVEDIINLIEFYLNPKSDFITGQVVYLGGVS
jgi:3-oxoacyl-[acyl-carrier protein] reductase